MGGCGSGGRFFFVTASLMLTGASILVGISFFGPFWLSNVHQAGDSNEDYITTQLFGVDVGLRTPIVSARPDRGLWAQCGKECTWFWENGYELQHKKFTKLKWHIATQVIYFVAATLMLLCEIFARVQRCCHGDDSSCIFAAIASLVLTSAGLQTAALIVFGAGSATHPYNAESDPITITHIIRNEITANQQSIVYLGWCYWVAVTGAIMTLVSGIFFIMAACCRKGQCCECCEDSDDCCCRGLCCCCSNDY